jgi:capsular exopolysaccharide synthesis family protein
MELRDYIRILRAHWRGVVLLVIAVLALTALYTFTQDKVYAADARGFVSTGPSDNPALGSVNDQLAKSRATSYVDIATSRATARDVKRQLGLRDDPSSLVGRISVEQPADTVLIKISARADNPRDAQALADAWVTALADQVAQIEDPQGKDLAGTPRVVPVESAALPKAPVSPRPERNLALGLVLGLLLGFAYAMVRNVLDRRLRTPDQVESRFDVNVVGMVPKTDVLGHKPTERAHLALEARGTDAAAGAGEAFRKLRTNLTYMDVDNPPKVIVVTSPKPGDGKSTVASNLAAAIAFSGQQVVLVDADLRRPTQATSLGLVEGVGLTDVLVGRVHPKDALQPSAEHDNLMAMAAGRIPPNPSELLGSNVMRQLVTKLAEGGAMVILDAPPLLPVTDAAVLTANADGALVVISAGQTIDAELRTSLDHLDDVKGRALGVILNKIVQRGSYYSYYYSGDYTAAEADQPRGWRSWFVRKPKQEAWKRPTRTTGTAEDGDSDSAGDRAAASSSKR